MNFVRKYWVDFGIILSVLSTWYLTTHFWMMSSLKLVALFNLIALFIHQFEEYRLPGHFPQVLNWVLFESQFPNKYPLNSNSAFIINVGVGWGSYLLAFIFASQMPWLVVATLLISVGNILLHIFILNIKGKRFYNPGMVSAIILFLPIVCYAFYLLRFNHSITSLNLIVGIILGLILNYFGVLKLIDFLKDKETKFIFK